MLDLFFFFFYKSSDSFVLFGGIYYITPNQLSEKLGAALIVWREERG